MTEITAFSYWNAAGLWQAGSTAMANAQAQAYENEARLRGGYSEADIEAGKNRSWI